MEEIILIPDNSNDTNANGDTRSSGLVDFYKQNARVSLLSITLTTIKSY